MRAHELLRITLLSTIVLMGSLPLVGSAAASDVCVDEVGTACVCVSGCGSGDRCLLQAYGRLFDTGGLVCSG